MPSAQCTSGKGLCDWGRCLHQGKIFFPIWLFVASGFEHSIANMYYIPAGILAKADPLFVEKALELGASQQAIDALGWSSIFSANLLPVTLGNILGGAFFVGLAYWLAYRRAA